MKDVHEFAVVPKCLRTLQKAVQEGRATDALVDQLTQRVEQQADPQAAVRFLKAAIRVVGGELPPHLDSIKETR